MGLHTGAPTVTTEGALDDLETVSASRFEHGRALALWDAVAIALGERAGE
jgi:hypothetical protein